MGMQKRYDSYTSSDTVTIPKELNKTHVLKVELCMNAVRLQALHMSIHLSSIFIQKK